MDAPAIVGNLIFRNLVRKSLAIQTVTDTTLSTAFEFAYKLSLGFQEHGIVPVLPTVSVSQSESGPDGLQYIWNHPCGAFSLTFLGDEIAYINTYFETTHEMNYEKGEKGPTMLDIVRVLLGDYDKCFTRVGGISDARI